MRLFNSSLAESMMTRAGFPEDMPLESKIVTRGIQSAQSQVESRNFEIRKNVLKYDDVMSRQRTVVYDERRRVLEGEDMHVQIQHFRTDVLTDYVAAATAEGRPEDWDLDALWTALKAVYPSRSRPTRSSRRPAARRGCRRTCITREILSDAEVAYAEREEPIGAENMRQLERRVTLSVLDRKWREHLYEMDYLKEGIGLRAMAQRDPLVEYQREGFQLFNAMNDAIKEETVGYLFNLEVQVQEPGPRRSRSTRSPPPRPARARRPPTGPPPPSSSRRASTVPSRQAPLQYSAPSVDGDGGVVTRAAAHRARTAGLRASAGPPAGGTVNREERRKAAKQQRKR